MDTSFARRLLVLLAFLFLPGCASLNGALKADPAEDSGFLPLPQRMTRVDNRYPFHRVWEAPEFSSAGEPIDLSIAPVDTSRLKNNSWYFRSNARAARAVRIDAEKIALHLENAFRNRLAQEHFGRFRLTDTISPDGVLLEMAIVELTPTDVSRNVLGNVASAFLPGASLLTMGSQGAIAIEAVVRRVSDGREIFMFADREKGKLAPVNFNDFVFFAHARAAIDDWADQFAELSGSFGPVQVADSSAVTLLPL